MNVGLQWLWYIGHFHVNLKKKKAVEYPVISWVMSTSSRIYTHASLPRMLIQFFKTNSIKGLLWKMNCK